MDFQWPVQSAAWVSTGDLVVSQNNDLTMAVEYKASLWRTSDRTGRNGGQVEAGITVKMEALKPKTISSIFLSMSYLPKSEAVVYHTQEW